MAKKRRKDDLKKEEEYEFIPPEFDEKAFLLKDTVGTKALMLTAIMAIVFGILAFAVSIISSWLGFIMLVVGAIALRYAYPLIKMQREDVDKKTQAGNYVLFFLLFLGIWILLLNPPFSG